jgi:hypothetical protein
MHYVAAKALKFRDLSLCLWRVIGDGGRSQELASHSVGLAVLGSAPTQNDPALVGQRGKESDQNLGNIEFH